MRLSQAILGKALEQSHQYGSSIGYGIFVIPLIRSFDLIRNCTQKVYLRKLFSWWVSQLYSRITVLKEHSLNRPNCVNTTTLWHCTTNCSLQIVVYNGSTEFCTDGNTTFARSAEVVNFCASSNHIVSVKQIKKCTYIIMVGLRNNSEISQNFRIW